MRWFAAYERAWRAGDIAGMRALFTEDAEYWYTPHQPPEVGHTAIAAFWADDVNAEFTVTAEMVAVDGLIAVIRLEVPLPRRARPGVPQPVGAAVCRGRSRRQVRGVGVLPGQADRTVGASGTDVGVCGSAGTARARRIPAPYVRLRRAFRVLACRSAPRNRRPARPALTAA